jgi:hypothetical protein
MDSLLRSDCAGDHNSEGEEVDYDRIRFGAPWVRETWDELEGIVEDLRRYRRAVVTCPNERKARGLAATVTEKRLHVWIYSPTGRITTVR